MKLFPGIIVRKNAEIVASVSSENLNIISVRLHGDTVSPEVATLDVTGGYYGEPDETRHLLWVVEQEISERDEIEIQFKEVAASSHRGKSIEEVFPEEKSQENAEPQDIVELAKWLADKPRLRNGFELFVGLPDAEPKVLKVRDPEYSFFVSVMWDWKSTNSAKVRVSSATIQSIADQQPGTTYLRDRLNEGQSIYVRIGT